MTIYYHILITKNDVLIINSRGHILHPYRDGNQGLRVKLNGRREYVHRLVAQYKLGANLKTDLVIHIDNNKLNNHPSNLKVIRGVMSDVNTY